MAGLRNISVAGGASGVVYALAGCQRSGAARHNAPSGATLEGDRARRPEVVGGGEGLRAERIRALREQIQSGTYNPDPYLIARRLLERGF